MANAQGGQGQNQGQGGHGQTFTSAQHDKALGRESTGPGVKHGQEESRGLMDGAESTIDPPQSGSGDDEAARQGQDGGAHGGGGLG